MIDYQAFGLKVYTARTEKQLTRDQAAEACGITTVFLRQIESGARIPSLPKLVALCNALGVSPAYLLSDSLENVYPDQFERIIGMLTNATPNQAELITAVLETMNTFAEKHNHRDLIL